MNFNIRNTQGVSPVQLMDEFAASTKQGWSSFSQCVANLFSQLSFDCLGCVSVQDDDDWRLPSDSKHDLSCEVKVTEPAFAQVNADAYIDLWQKQCVESPSIAEISNARRDIQEYFEQNYGDQKLSTSEVEALYKSSVEQQHAPSDSTESILSEIDAPEVEVPEWACGLSPRVLEILKAQLKDKGMEPVVVDAHRHVVSELRQRFSPR